jgi:hypothetical protein
VCALLGSFLSQVSLLIGRWTNDEQFGCVMNHGLVWVSLSTGSPIVPFQSLDGVWSEVFGSFVSFGKVSICQRCWL